MPQDGARGQLTFRISLDIFIAPAYSKVRYRGSTFRPFVLSFVRPSVHNLCQGAYSVAVIAGSIKYNTIQYLYSK